MSLIETPPDAPESYRDLTASLKKDGQRKWIFPKKPKGRLYTARTIVSWFLLAFLFGAPFLRVDGHPFMLLNVLERKFILFGMVFFPQDFYLVVLALLTLLVSVFLFTAVFGRVWCGWLCPQTVFMEMVFRRIEYLIEGDARKQRQLDEAPLTPVKLFKKTLKLGIFYALSFFIANIFLAWIIGVDELRKIVTAPPGEHLTGFIAINIFTFLFFGVFAWFREQACVVVCPYGRYQSALVDANTIVVAYDFKRGEPRGRLVRIEKRLQSNDPLPQRGDCVDCKQCVEVCPTGIDIRNGIQLECVNCTACIDACNAVMDKIKKPRGLIRFTSQTAITEGHSRWLTPRVLSYAAVWLVITSLFLVFFFRRPMTEVLILRQPGTLAQQQANGDFINFYVLQLVNKHNYDVPIEVKLLSPQQGTITLLNEMSPVPAISEKGGRFMLLLPKEQIASADQKVKFGIYSNGTLLKEVETRFLATTIRPH
ncbi:MAG TPA: cytochrome c oxidase accessory protein CcoG [Blastocatellia bacterium]|nr:cytochrome c oxidase accessory protein CcoG [Blastocatellia bacterium]